MRAAQPGSADPAPVPRELPSCSVGKGLLKRVSSINNIIESSAVLDKALRTSVACEKGFLEGSGAQGA